MTTLSFTTENGAQVATFTAGENSVLQLKLAESNLPVPVSIYARIDASMDWKLVKKACPSPTAFLCQLDVPEGLLIKVEVLGTVTSGGIM